MTISDAFDDFAIEYDRWFEDHEIEYSLKLEAIRMLLPEKVDGIEVGAGTGRFTKPLGISLGIEPSEAMRNLALGRGSDVIAGPAESLPAGDDLYDFVLFEQCVKKGHGEGSFAVVRAQKRNV